MNIHNLLFALFITVSAVVEGQGITPVQYAIPVVNDLAVYRRSIRQDSNQRMVSVAAMIPSIELRLAYSTSLNFTHAIIYREQPAETYLRLPVARALAKVSSDLLAVGLGIRIWDAYRPYAATVTLWEKMRDARYAADPAKGSGHNRGVAVDLTIIDLQTHQELSMPTPFDSFSDTAHADFTTLSPEVLRNRKLLTDLMTHYGFTQLPTEWWHFSWADPENYPLMDFTFAQLRGEAAVPTASDRPIRKR